MRPCTKLLDRLPLVGLWGAACENYNPPKQKAPVRLGCLVPGRRKLIPNLLFVRTCDLIQRFLLWGTAFVPYLSKPFMRYRISKERMSAPHPSGKFIISLIPMMRNKDQDQDGYDKRLRRFSRKSFGGLASLGLPVAYLMDFIIAGICLLGYKFLSLYARLKLALRARSAFACGLHNLVNNWS